MKIRFLLSTFAVIVVGAGIAYIIYSKKKVVDDSQTTTSKYESDEYPTIVYSIGYDEGNQLFKDRQRAADIINNRHIVAAQQIKESLTNILNEDSVKVTFNSETLEYMLEDLDKMVSAGNENE